MKRKKVAVTGATGFLGKNLVPALLASGFEVHVISEDTERPFGTQVTYHVGDLTRSMPVLPDLYAIVHLAGKIDITGAIQYPPARLKENLDMTLAVLEAARASKKKPLIVFASTDHVYGKNSLKTVSETTPTSPLEPYTASKLLSETTIATYAHLFSIPYIILRFSSLYGTHQRRSMFVSDIIQKMRDGTDIETGSLNVWKRFLYVDDAVKAIQAALQANSKAHNRIYNISGQNVRMNTVCTICKNIVSKAMRKKITVRQTLNFGRPSAVEIAPYKVSNAQAKKYLGWSPTVPLTQGLRMTVEYFLQDRT